MLLSFMIKCRSVANWSAECQLYASGKALYLASSDRRSGVALHDDASTLPDPAPRWSHHGFTHHGLYPFEIDVSGRSIRQIPPLLAPGGPDAVYDPVDTDRGLILDDTVHYLHAGRFTSGLWGE